MTWTLIKYSALNIWSRDLVGEFKRPDAEGFLEMRHNIHSDVRCGDLLYCTVNQMQKSYHEVPIKQPPLKHSAKFPTYTLLC